MSQNNQGFKTFLASGAITAYLVVDIQSDGTIKAAANDAKGIGVLQEDASDANYANVKLWTAPGTFEIAISGGHAVTAATSYATITGGYVGPITSGVVTTARVTAIASNVAGNGIIAEFVKI